MLGGVRTVSLQRGGISKVFSLMIGILVNAALPGTGVAMAWAIGVVDCWDAPGSAG